MKKIVYLVGILLFTVACGDTKEVVISQVDAERASTIFPGTTTEILLQGQKLYNVHCMKCHQFSPTKFKVHTWEKYMPEMGKLANIDSKTQETILKYVATFSKK